MVLEARDNSIPQNDQEVTRDPFLGETKYKAIDGLDDFRPFLVGSSMEVLLGAVRAASEFGHYDLGSGHILLGIATMKERAPAAVILEAENITAEEIKEEMERIKLPNLNRRFGHPEVIRLSAGATNALNSAVTSSREHGLNAVTSEQLLFEVAKENTGVGGEVLRRLSNPGHIQRRLKQIIATIS